MLAAFIARVRRKRSEDGDNVKELVVEEDSMETEDEKGAGDTREVLLDLMADQPYLDQFSPEVSIYTSSGSESEELPELSAGPL